MAEWVALRPICDVCKSEMVYEGGGELQVQWWRQVAVENQLNGTVEEILVVARLRQCQESGRSGTGTEIGDAQSGG